MSWCELFALPFEYSMKGRLSVFREEMRAVMLKHLRYPHENGVLEKCDGYIGLAYGRVVDNSNLFNGD